ncbi:hypothetical protein [Pseudonocardia sp. TMWB2A]|uniref:hypothetical protein n=1 Tax=Pseudonocardia sp. TMWB2A TaxID=687430 RepID=UPI00307E34D3
MPSDGIIKETPETTKEQARPDTAAAKAQERAEKVGGGAKSGRISEDDKATLPSRLREGSGVGLLNRDASPKV